MNITANIEDKVTQKKVLVVEDNDLNMKLFRDLLKLNNLAVYEIKDGFKAHEMAREINPDLILMDIQLQGISGHDIVRRIKSDPKIKDIPIITVTAFAMSEDRNKLLNYGCCAYVTKPISIGPFIEMVNKFIR